MSCRRTGRSIDSTGHVHAPVKLAVQTHKHDPQHGSRTDGNERGRAVDNKGHRVRRPRAVGVHVAGVDAARVGHGVDECQRGGALGRRARDGVADPGQGDDVARVDRGDHQAHADVAGRQGRGGGGQHEGGDGREERDGDVQVALARAVGVQGVAVGGDDGQDVGRRREEERVDI